ncbi:hypothetical protein QOZ80_1BG0088200 [Eleusine coracana subsp. coracana]|nr:hypothetical protein QOZ80_1BG0088200 [Eleusine coracana subsp. coracana]
MAELFGLTSLYIVLGVLAGVALLGAILWAACCTAERHDSGGGASSEVVVHGDGKREGLLNKDAVVIAVVPPPGGQQGQSPEAAVDNSSSDAALCAICKGRLMGQGVEGPCRRLRPCGHVYHAECIDLWLQRKWICPLCRAGVVVSRTETIDAMV